MLYLHEMQEGEVDGLAMTEEARRLIDALRQIDENDCEYEARDVVTNLNKAANLIESLSAQLDQVTRERDAAVEDMILGRICATCRYHNNSATSKCAGCLSWHSNWQWRGVEKER